jgi:hypothetical protein
MRSISLRSFRLKQSLQQPQEQNSSHHVGVHCLYVSNRGQLSKTISQPQGRGAKEDGAKDIGYVEINRQFEHSLLHWWHRSCRACRQTLTTSGFNEINFLSDCLTHLHTLYLLYLLWLINFELIFASPDIFFPDFLTIRSITYFFLFW